MDSETRGAIEQLAGMIAREFARVFERFDAVDRRFDQHDERFDEINVRLDWHERRINSIEAQLRDFRREVKSEFVSVRHAIQVLEQGT